jgi:hypothetical protein
MLNAWTAPSCIAVGFFVGAALVALQGCSENSDPMSAARTTASIPPQCPDLLASGRAVFPLDEEERRYFALSNYLRFPSEDRSLLQRADVENARCRGGLGNVPETFRACNRRHCVMLELERRGWCWGGGDSGATDDWVRCSEIPDDPPLEPELPYPEDDLRQRFPPGAVGGKPIAEVPIQAIESGARAAQDNDQIE